MKIKRVDVVVHWTDDAGQGQRRSFSFPTACPDSLKAEQVGAFCDAVGNAARNAAGTWVPPNEFAQTSDDADTTVSEG